MWLLSALAPALYKGYGLLAAIILYGCVVVTTSAAKLLEDQETETRIHGPSLKLWSWFAFIIFNV